MWFDSRRRKQNFVLRKRLRLTPETSEPPVHRVSGRAGKEAKPEADHSPMFSKVVNTLSPELNPICYLLALLLAHHFLHVSRIRVKLLTFTLLISYIYMEHPFLMFLDHTQRRSTVGRTPLDE